MISSRYPGSSFNLAQPVAGTALRDVRDEKDEGCGVTLTCAPHESVLCASCGACTGLSTVLSFWVDFLSLE